MARTNVPVVTLTRDGLTTPGTTAVDVANGHELAYIDSSDFFIEVNNTAGTAKNVTLRRGSVELAPGAMQDLVLQVPNAARRFLGPFDTARFAQVGGKVNVDLESGFTGTIGAYEVR